MNRFDQNSYSQEQCAWQTFEHSGKVADYLFYARCAHTGINGSCLEDRGNAAKNNGTGAQTEKHRGK